LSPPSRSGRPTRTVSRAAVRPQLLVYVEGARTEEDYLVYWSRLYRTRVRVTIAPERGVPTTLVAHAIEAKKAGVREEKRGRGSAWDEIWCMFDEDAHPGLHDAIASAAANDIKLAVTNPCVELWFILHFEDQTGHIERQQAQSRARHHLSCEKALSDTALDLLGRHYENARARAIALDAKHAGDGSPTRSNPSSEVWKLVDRIRAA
jgi:RloB-like protein